MDTIQNGDILCLIVLGLIILIGIAHYRMDRANTNDLTHIYPALGRGKKLSITWRLYCFYCNMKRKVLRKG